MHSTRVPISARISQEDAEFISQLHLPGAKTPSDKLRLIIEEARNREERLRDYVGCLEFVQELINPAVKNIRKSEMDSNMHSELVQRITDWLPDAVAYLISSARSVQPGNESGQLQNIEDGLATKIFLLMSSLFQLALNDHMASYREGLVKEKIAPLLVLSKMISDNQS